MQVKLTNIGKKFHEKWVFKNLTLDFEPGLHHAILGKNGSGKSTLIKIIAGYLSATTGKVTWLFNKQAMPPEKVFRHVAVASPYLELIQEFNIREAIAFQKKFKPFREGYSEKDLEEISGLSAHLNKPLKHFSSGMRQRVSLLLAIMSSAELVLLDEPCANLDSEATQWYQDLVQEFCTSRSLIIASNHHPAEYASCENIHSLP